MIYDYTLTIPANTTEEEPAEKLIRLTHGIVHEVDVVFPDGCAGMVYMRIFDNGHQAWPSNPGEAFHASGTTIRSKEHYKITSGFTMFRLVGYSPGSVFPHKITVKIDILLEHQLSPWILMKDLVNILKKLIGLD